MLDLAAKGLICQSRWRCMSDDEIPTLEAALKRDFKDLKAGEKELLELPPQQKTPTSNDEKNHIEYGKVYEDSITEKTFIVSSIKSTQDTIEVPLKIKDKLPEENTVEIQAVSIIKSTPSSSLGDDFDVEW